jgi:hypothetical protein
MKASLEHLKDKIESAGISYFGTPKDLTDVVVSAQADTEQYTRESCIMYQGISKNNSLNTIVEF